jgi:hypothetical protein
MKRPDRKKDGRTCFYSSCYHHKKKYFHPSSSMEFEPFFSFFFLLPLTRIDAGNEVVYDCEGGTQHLKKRRGEGNTIKKHNNF